MTVAAHSPGNAMLSIPRARLTARQQLVLRLIADGKNTDEMAGELSVSRNTVRDHIRMILAKFNARDRAHAIAIAMREGLLE